MECSEMIQFRWWVGNSRGMNQRSQPAWAITVMNCINELTEHLQYELMN